LAGILFYFVRATNTKAISVASVSNEVNFGVIDATNGKLLDAIEKMLAAVILPALTNLDDWGSLKSRNNPQVQYYVESLDHFVANINGLKSNMSNQVKLVPSDSDGQLATLNSVGDYQNASMNGEFLASCEDLLASWCKQIAKVLTESEQIRREADDTGPYCNLASHENRPYIHIIYVFSLMFFPILSKLNWPIGNKEWPSLIIYLSKSRVNA
jgi:dynein heavy chain